MNLIQPDVHAILAKASATKGLTIDEAAVLLDVTDQDLIQEIFDTAKRVKEAIYGKRIVIFAPLYISNLCNNECSYCAFRASNKELRRRFLSQEEIAREVEILVNQGHKRILLVAGESYPNNDLQYVLDSIATVYKTQTKNGAIRRLNVNLAPLTVDDFKRLKQASIGTYQLFQETYHRDTYKKVHLSGKKSDYDWRFSAFDRAMEAGVDDVGIGALFGLHDWRLETLAILRHAEYLSNKYGVGPHTISVPRLEPALGSEIASNPLNKVSDLDFCKIVAVLRLAVPYTGIIMSTRETAELRRKTFALGVSQVSAGSRTDPGGYADSAEQKASQFTVGDHRTLDEVVRDIASFGYIPSFCTACYRSGRTGEDFMCIAKPGNIKEICAPNALATFQEYLLDYASDATKKIGVELIKRELAEMTSKQREISQKLIDRLNSGVRDVYV